MPHRPQPKGLLARLDAFLDCSGGEDACWPAVKGLARGSRRETHYAIIQEGGHRGKFWRVPRLVLLLEELPEEVVDGGDERALLRWLRLANLYRREVEAAHACDNSVCGNPRHLEWKGHSEQVSEQARRRARAREAGASEAA